MCHPVEVHAMKCSNMRAQSEITYSTFMLKSPDWIPSPNNPQCVEQYVKPYSLTHSLHRLTK